MDASELGGEAAVLASRIRTLDRELDRLEASTRNSVVIGMKVAGGLAGGFLKLRQIQADAQHERLLRERAELVSRLKALVKDPEQGDRIPWAEDRCGRADRI